MRKILIIKTGYSETADADISRYSSIGDVLRTTVILHKFKEDKVTWLTDERSVPILFANSYIDRILIWDTTTLSLLLSEFFDVVINLEKVPGLCALADHIFSRKRCKLYGFGFNPMTGEAVPNDNAEYVFGLTKDLEQKRSHTECWQQLLYSIIGEKWQGEEYILGYKPESAPDIVDVGLNDKVGNKWPTKKWSQQNWARLKYKLRSLGYGAQSQPDETTIFDYIDWINECKVLVTCDSLGLHIALALKKKVIVLCGPTHAAEIDLYGRGKIITGEKCFIGPCLKSICTHSLEFKNICMESIIVNKVIEAVKEIE